MRRSLDSVLHWKPAQALASLVCRNVDLVDLLQSLTVMRIQVVTYGERLCCADVSRAE